MMNIRSIRHQFAKELGRRMEDEGLGIEDIAEYCQITPDKIKFCLELGSFPDPWTLILMADCLWCTVNDLLGYGGVKDFSELSRCQPTSAFSSKKDYSMHFHTRLRRQLNDCGITPEELSLSTDIAIGTIKHWLSNRPSMPQTPDPLRLADALNCTPSDLLGY